MWGQGLILPRGCVGFEDEPGEVLHDCAKWNGILDVSLAVENISSGFYGGGSTFVVA